MSGDRCEHGKATDDRWCPNEAAGVVHSVTRGLPACVEHLDVWESLGWRVTRTEAGRGAGTPCPRPDSTDDPSLSSPKVSRQTQRDASGGIGPDVVTSQSKEKA